MLAAIKKWLSTWQNEPVAATKQPLVNPKKSKKFDLPLRAKFASVLAVGSISSIIIAIVGYTKLGTMHDSITDIVDHTVVEINLGLRLNRAMGDVDRAQKNILLADSLEEIASQENMLKRYKNEVKTSSQELGQLVGPPLKAKLAAIDLRFDEYIAVQQHIIDLVKIDFAPPTTESTAPSKAPPTFETLNRQLNDIAALCHRSFPNTVNYKKSLCQLVTADLKQNLKIINSAREGLLMTDMNSPVTAGAQQAFTDSISEAYVKLEELEHILGSDKFSLIEDFTDQFGMWLFSEMNLSWRKTGDGSRKALALFRSRGLKLAEEINILTTEIVSYIDTKLTNEKKQSKAIYSNGGMIFLGLSALCTALSFVFGYKMLSDLTSSLKRLTHMARRVATGDLTARTPISSQDQLGELGVSLNRMALKIHSFTDELKKSRQHAEAANLMKSQFLANMSHEIRTPMNGVLGMTELMSMTKLNRVQRRYLDRIRESGDVLLALVNDILDFSKIEAGKLDLDQVEFDLFKAVEDVAAILAHRAQSKGLELICDIDPHAGRWVIGDPGRIRQIILNLISNAVKFTEKGEIVVRMRSEFSSPSEQVAIIDVIDTGIGIDDETKRYLFRPFVQADSSTTRTFGGTGLGLAITKRLVKSMGGEIKVVSSVGGGSQFSIHLPFTVTEGEVAAGDLDQPFLLGKRILLVDGNDTALKILGAHLTYWGAQVVMVRSGSDALDQMRRSRQATRGFDIVVIDLNLPVMDGNELANALAAGAGSSDFKVIMLTPVCVEKEDERRMRSPIIASQLVKPLRLSELKTALEGLNSTSKNKVLAPSQPEHETSDGDGERDISEPAEPLPHVGGQGGDSKGVVLIAEDNVINQDVAVGLLSRCGFEARIAHNGVEALSLAARHHFVAILMDCQMPEMDGYRAAKEIRRLEASGYSGIKTPIIAMTASAFRGDRDRCLAAGMDDYLAKPVTYEKLKKILDRWVPQEQKPASDHSDEPDHSDKKETAPDQSNGEAFLAPTEDASPHASEVPSLDHGALQQIRDLEATSRPGFFLEIVTVFVKSADEHLDLLSRSIHDANAVKIEREAHFLKGSAGNFGARRVVALCQELETVAREKNLANVHVLEKRLRQEYQVVKAELQKEVGQQLH